MAINHLNFSLKQSSTIMKEPNKNKSKNYNADGGSNVRAMTAVLRGGDSRKNPLNKKPFLARSKVALTTIV
jgi:hypothetical protein